MNAASHVPSGVLISTFSSPTCCAVTSEPAAAARPAATVIVTKSRRVSSSFDMFLVLSLYRSTSSAQPPIECPPARGSYARAWVGVMVRLRVITFRGLYRVPLRSGAPDRAATAGEFHGREHEPGEECAVACIREVDVVVAD